MKRINVLHVINSLEIGGAEESLLSILKRLNRDKYNVQVCCLKKEGELAEDVKKLGINVINLAMKSTLDLTIVNRLKSLMRKEKIQLLHTHLAYGDTIGFIAGKLLRVPIILSSKASIVGWGSMVGSKGEWIRAFVEKTSGRYMDKTIVLSDALRLFLIKERKISGQKIAVIHYGVDTNKFDIEVDVNKKKAEFGINSKDSVVGIVARLEPRKDHKYFLEAAAKILEVLPKTKFLVVGDGPLRQELEELSIGLGISENVTFTGSRRDIPQILAIFDVSVLSSWTEGLGFVLMESMAMHKPVVATQVGGVPEVVTSGVDGFLVPPKDATALSEVIANLLRDKELARNMGKQGRRKIEERFSIENMVGKIESVYDELIKKKLQLQYAEEIGWQCIK